MEVVVGIPPMLPSLFVPVRGGQPFSILVRGFFGIKICSESFICIPLGTSALSKGADGTGDVKGAERFNSQS